VKEQLILTILADDRPGLVETISERISRYGGSWLESRMSRLSGKFAGILRIEVADERMDELAHALDKLRADGLRIQVETTSVAETIDTRETFLLELVGQDRPDIVRTLATTLAQFRVNVESLETECSSAAMSGETLFQAKAQLRIPSDTDRDALHGALEKIAADLLVDLDLKPSD